MNHFHTLVGLEQDDDVVEVMADVTYEMRDMGVMMKRNENVQPVILEVLDVHGEDLLDRLNEDEVRRLKEYAKAYDEDSYALRRDDENRI